MNSLRLDLKIQAQGQATLNKRLSLPLAIVGYGISGKSIHRLLTSLGVSAEHIFIFDDKTTKEDGKDFCQKNNIQSLVVSPGYPLATNWIKEFRITGGKLFSELEIASWFLEDEKFIGITGSVGKSTVAALLHEGAKCFNGTTDLENSFLGGNFGIPLADYVFELFAGVRSRRANYLIIELSSYQLENFESLKAYASIVTHLSSNHLERYDSKEDYFQAKWNLVRKTTDYSILNANGGELLDFFETQKHANSMNSQCRHLFVSREKNNLPPHFLSSCSLLGSHNQDNISLVAVLALKLQWHPNALTQLQLFKGLPHRIENLGIRNGIRFINDSKATTITSVKQALKSAFETNPKGTVHLMLGGKDKNLPWDELSEYKAFENSNKRVRFYFFGSVASHAQKMSTLQGPIFDKIGACFSSIEKVITSGDVLLLSPGGSSLDEFKSFEERGNYFRNLVEQRWPHLDQQ